MESLLERFYSKDLHKTTEKDVYMVFSPKNALVRKRLQRDSLRRLKVNSSQI